MTITPYCGGHMVGGTIWKIVKDGEEEIVYAVDFNHKKERFIDIRCVNCYPSPFPPFLSLSLSRHLDGAIFDSLSRPHLLITDAYNALSVQARRKERDKALLGITHCITLKDKL